MLISKDTVNTKMSQGFMFKGKYHLIELAVAVWHLCHHITYHSLSFIQRENWIQSTGPRTTWPGQIKPNKTFKDSSLDHITDERKNFNGNIDQIITKHYKQSMKGMTQRYWFPYPCHSFTDQRITHTIPLSTLLV